MPCLSAPRELAAGRGRGRGRDRDRDRRTVIAVYLAHRCVAEPAGGVEVRVPLQRCAVDNQAPCNWLRFDKRRRDWVDLPASTSLAGP